MSCVNNTRNPWAAYCYVAAHANKSKVIDFLKNAQCRLLETLPPFWLANLFDTDKSLLSFLRERSDALSVEQIHALAERMKSISPAKESEKAALSLFETYPTQNHAVFAFLCGADFKKMARKQPLIMYRVLGKIVPRTEDADALFPYLTPEMSVRKWRYFSSEKIRRSILLAPQHCDLDCLFSFPELWPEIEETVREKTLAAWQDVYDELIYRLHPKEREKAGMNFDMAVKFSMDRKMYPQIRTEKNKGLLYLILDVRNAEKTQPVFSLPVYNYKEKRAMYLRIEDVKVLTKNEQSV